MKRIALVFLLVVCAIGAAVPAGAQINNSRSQARELRKAEKRRQKAAKKYAKAQKKAERKMLKTERKNTHYPTQTF